MNGPIVIGRERSEVGPPAATTTSAVITGHDPLRIYQTFTTVVLLCRGLVE